MKILKYNMCAKVNRGTQEQPQWEEILSPVTMGWNETNEEIAKREAYNGEYTIEDDGVEDDGVEDVLSPTQRIAELEEALELLLAGVTE